MKFAINTTRSGRAGLTNAETSVLSASGSWLISGASRWLDARSGLSRTPPARIARTTQTSFFTQHLLLVLLRGKVATGCVRWQEAGGGCRLPPDYGMPTRYFSPVGAGTPPEGSRVTATATG